MLAAHARLARSLRHRRSSVRQAPLARRRINSSQLTRSRNPRERCTTSAAASAS
jgi:hypothetical protein